MAKIELENVWKRFGRVEAVVDLTLDIPDGSFIALLGPSGCGKTTTMNMLSGLLQPTSGEIRFNGEVVNDLHPGKRNVGFVFQNYAIFTHMSAFDNIAFGLRVVRKQPAETVEREVERVAELLDISHLLEQRAADLSVNDMQKVAIGRSMITNPGIFLLDEPFSNLDAAFRAYMRAEMKKLQRELRQTMIYVTHDQVEAMGLGERIAVLEAGTVHQIGTPAQVYDDPRDAFVATFIGSPPMNLIRTDAAFVGVRPEHLLPRTAFAADERTEAYPLVVHRVENLGADRYVYGTLQPPHPQVHVIARLPSLLPFATADGERHEFAVRARDLRRFALADGRRLEAAA